MKNNKLRILAVLGVLLLLTLACTTTLNLGGTAEKDPVIPRLTDDTGWWYDTTGTISREYLSELDHMSDLAEKDGWQIGGVIWNNSVSEPSQICSDFGNDNGIGDKEKDNGIAICVFLEKEGDDGHAPYIFVAIGKGLEGTLPDSKVGWFLENYFFPAREEGKWEEGLTKLIDALHRFLQDPENPEFVEEIPWGLIIAVIVLVILFVALDIGFTGGKITYAIVSAAAKGGGGRFGGGGAGG